MQFGLFWCHSWRLKIFLFTFGFEHIYKSNYGPELHPTFRLCPQWFIFFKNLFYKKQCKYIKNFGIVQIRGAHLKYISCPFIHKYLWQMLPSISKVTPDIWNHKDNVPSQLSPQWLYLGGVWYKRTLFWWKHVFR